MAVVVAVEVLVEVSVIVVAAQEVKPGCILKVVFPKIAHFRRQSPLTHMLGFRSLCLSKEVAASNASPGFLELMTTSCFALSKPAAFWHCSDIVCVVDCSSVCWCRTSGV